MSADNTLRCRNAAEAFLLLKSSLFVSDDLELLVAGQPVGGSPPPVLALKKWTQVDESMEFRAFVKDHNLIAVSQRHTSSFFPFLQSLRNEIRTVLQEFFLTKLLPRANVLPAAYSFDVYFDRRKQPRLLDIGKFGNTKVDALLYSWEELLEFDATATATDTVSPAVRIIDDGKCIVTSPLATHRLPKDMIDVSDSEAIRAFVQTMRTLGNVQNIDVVEKKQ